MEEILSVGLELKWFAGRKPLRKLTKCALSWEMDYTEFRDLSIANMELADGHAAP